MIAPRSLYLLAAAFTAAGLVFRVLPLRSPAPAAAAPPPASAPPPAVSPGDGSLGAEIVASNVFSPRRAPPATRFLPEWAKRDTAPSPRPRRRPPEQPRIRLYGITKGPDGAVALIDADPRVEGGEVYRVGDTVRGARLTAVTDSSVVMDGPSGRLILRLPAGESER